MTETDKLRGDALDVNTLLENYISVHDALIRQSGILGLFRPINFDGLSSKTLRVLSELRNKQNDIETLRREAEHSRLSPVERQFVVTLSDYTAALVRTVELLLGMLTELVARAEGEGRLTLRKHIRKHLAYEQARSEYAALGDRLNELYRALGR